MRLVQAPGWDRLTQRQLMQVHARLLCEAAAGEDKGLHPHTGREEIWRQGTKQILTLPRL